MEKNTTTVTFLAGLDLLQKIDDICQRRSKRAWGHVTRSTVIREALGKLIEAEDHKQEGSQ